MQSRDAADARIRARMRAQRLLRFRMRTGADTMLSVRGADACSLREEQDEAVVRADGVAQGEAVADEGELKLSVRRKKPLFSFWLPFVAYGETDGAARRAVLGVFSVLPEGTRREIETAVRGEGKDMDILEEIRLSLLSQSSIVMSGRERTLSPSLTKEDFAGAVRGICHGTPFSYRAELAEGYLPFAGGVRVGAVGEAHYDEAGALAGISDIHTLTFRIPHKAPCGEAVEQIRTFLLQNMRRGCLLFGAPGAGKTTLLRALSRALASGEGARRVVVIDTRREFSAEDGKGAIMDIMTGYRRTEGIMIALRTLSAGYIAMDEIGTAEDVDAVRSVLAAGVPLLATAHAGGVEDLCKRRALRMLLEEGAFDYLLGIERGRDGMRLSLYYA